jgi:hypothetical protein
MRWIRKNRRTGGVLALLALFFQLAVGLTHVHAVPHGGAPEPAAVTVAGGSDHGAPDEHRSHLPQGGAACDLCILLHAAAIGDVAAPPALASRSGGPTLVRLAIAADQPARTARHFLPQSRAPPAV